MRLFWGLFVQVPAALIAIGLFFMAREETIPPGFAYALCGAFVLIASHAGREAGRIREEQKEEEAIAPGSYWRRIMEERDAA